MGLLPHHLGRMETGGIQVDLSSLALFFAEVQAADAPNLDWFRNPTKILAFVLGQEGNPMATQNHFKS